MGLTSYAKHIVRASLFLLKAHELFRFLNRKKVIILLYHGVIEKSWGPFSCTQMTLQKFEQQMEYISKKYHVLPLTTLAENLINNEKLPDYSLAITFDDGFKNNYSTAFPVLERLNLPATIFLTTGNIGTDRLLWADEVILAFKGTDKTSIDLQEEGLGVFSLATPEEKQKTTSTLLTHMKTLQKNEKDVLLSKILNKLDVDPKSVQEANFLGSMDWDDIITMHQSNLISFGAHTETHNIMTRLTKEEVVQELEISKKKIEENLNSSCRLFAYPNGQRSDYNNEIKDAVKKSGFLCAFTAVNGFTDYSTDAFEIGRFPINPNFDEQLFKLVISGVNDFVTNIADRFVST